MVKENSEQTSKIQKEQSNISNAQPPEHQVMQEEAEPSDLQKHETKEHFNNDQKHEVERYDGEQPVCIFFWSKNLNNLKNHESLEFSKNSTINFFLGMNKMNIY